MTATRAMCTFVLDGRLFGVGVEWVQEVLRPQPVTRLPLAGPTVRGLINLRGQIVPAVELRRCLGLPERPPGVEPLNVVVRHRDQPVSLLVDEIGDVLEVGEDLFEPVPETLQGVQRERVRAVGRLEGRLLMVLEVPQVLEDAA
jgi:purine-binding chemotaxis protein CheW